MTNKTMKSSTIPVINEVNDHKTQDKHKTYFLLKLSAIKPPNIPKVANDKVNPAPASNPK